MASAKTKEAGTLTDVSWIEFQHADIHDDGDVTPEDVQVRFVEGREAISKVFEYTVHLVCTNPAGLDVKKLIRSSATLVFKTRGAPKWEEVLGEETNQVVEKAAPESTTNDEVATGIELRRVHGIIRSARDRLSSEAAHGEYVLEIVPRFWETSLSKKDDIYQEMSLKEIIESVLKDGDLAPGADLEVDLPERDKKSKDKREFVVQYHESNLNFLQRWCEHTGVFYFFEHDKVDKVVFADENRRFPPLKPAAVQFCGRGEALGVFELERHVQMVTQEFTARDYNYRNPSNEIIGEASLSGCGAGTEIEFGAHVSSREQASWIALVRTEEASVRHDVLMGKSSDPRLAAGHWFTLEGHPSGDKELLILEVTHHYSAATMASAAAGDQRYKNEFKAIPRIVSFRPERVTPKPVIAGGVTGIVQHASESKFGAVDDHGRYRVQFMYDSVSDRQPGKASRALRMCQPSAGNTRGMHIPLVVGTEVVITHINGDPDRPVIAAAIPNAQTASPVTAANAEKTVLRTNTTQVEHDDNEPRIKTTVEGGDTTFQLGKPTEKAEEEGGFFGTVKNHTALAKGIQTTASEGRALYNHWKGNVTATNIWSMAGIPDPLKGWEKFSTIVKGAIGLVKAAGKLASEGRELYKKTYADKKKGPTEKVKEEKEKTKKLQKEYLEQTGLKYPQDAKTTIKTGVNPDGTTKEVIATETKEEFETRVLADGMKNDPLGNPRHIQIQYAEQVAAEKKLEKIEEEEKKADKEWNDAVKGDGGKDLLTVDAPSWEKPTDALQDAGHALLHPLDTLKKVPDKVHLKTDPMKITTADVLATADGVFDKIETALAAAKLISDIVKVFKKAEECANLLLMKGVQLAAKATSTVGRVDVNIESWEAPYNVQGSKKSAGMWGENLLLTGGKSAVMFSPVDASVLASGQAFLKGKMGVEVAASTEVILTAGKDINMWAKDNLVVTADNTKRDKAPADYTMSFMSKKGFQVITKTKDFMVKAKDNIKMEALEKDFDLKAKKNVKVTAKEDKIEITGQKKVSVKSKTDAVAVTAMKDATVESSSGALKLTAKAGSATLKGATGVKVEGPKVTIKGSLIKIG